MLHVTRGSSSYYAALAIVSFMAHVAVRWATFRLQAMKLFQQWWPIESEKPFPGSEYVLTTVSDALLLDRHTAGNLLLVSSWSSRTANLHRVRLDPYGPIDVVVKVLKDANEVAALVPALNELAGILSNECPDVLPLSAVGFTNGVIIPFVDGASLEQILKRENGGGNLSRDDISALITRAGRLLGRYHWCYAELSPRMIDKAWDHLEFRARNVFGPAAKARSIMSPPMVSRSLGDFHPGHLFAMSDGRLALIDPPSATQYCFVGRDIARFIDRMLMIVLSPPAVRQAPSQAFSYGELAAAFIRGYNEGRRVPLTRADRIATEIYLAYMLKKRLRSVMNGRWGALLYYGPMYFYRYRRTMKRLHTLRASRQTFS